MPPSHTRAPLRPRRRTRLHGDMEGDDGEQHATPLMDRYQLKKNVFFFFRERERGRVGGAPPRPPPHVCHAKTVTREPHSPR